MTTTTEATDTFVVRPSRPRMHREMAFNALSLVVVVLLFVVVEPPEWSVSTAFFAGLLVVSAIFQVLLWKRLLTLDRVLEIGPDGIGLAPLGRGWVMLPWDVVAYASGGLGGRFVVQPVRGATLPGTGPAARWAHRFGYKVGLRPTDATLDQALAAVGHLRPARS